MIVTKKNLFIVEFFEGYRTITEEFDVDDDGMIVLDPEDLKSLLWSAWLDCRTSVEKGRLVMRHGFLVQSEEEHQDE